MRHVLLISPYYGVPLGPACFAMSPPGRERENTMFCCESSMKKHRVLVLQISCFRLRTQKRKREIVCYQYRILMREHDICSAKTRCFAAKVRCKNIVFSASRAPNIVFSHFCPSRSSAKTRECDIISRFRATNIVFSRFRLRVQTRKRENALLIANNFAFSLLSAKAKTQKHEFVSRERDVYRTFEAKHRFLRSRHRAIKRNHSGPNGIPYSTPRILSYCVRRLQLAEIDIRKPCN